MLRLVSSEWLLKSLEIANIAQRAIAIDKHVVICGFGRSGQHLAKMLEQEGISFVALEQTPTWCVKPARPVNLRLWRCQPTRGASGRRHLARFGAGDHLR